MGNEMVDGVAYLTCGFSLVEDGMRRFVMIPMPSVRVPCQVSSLSAPLEAGCLLRALKRVLPDHRFDLVSVRMFSDNSARVTFRSADGLYVSVDVAAPPMTARILIDRILVEQTLDAVAQWRRRRR